MKNSARRSKVPDHRTVGSGDARATRGDHSAGSSGGVRGKHALCCVDGGSALQKDCPARTSSRVGRERTVSCDDRAGYCNDRSSLRGIARPIGNIRGQHALFCDDNRTNGVNGAASLRLARRDDYRLERQLASADRDGTAEAHLTVPVRESEAAEAQLALVHVEELGCVAAREGRAYRALDGHRPAVIHLEHMRKGDVFRGHEV